MMWLAVDMGDFCSPYRQQQPELRHFFMDGDTKRITIEEFNSDNIYYLSLEETKAKIASLEFIQNEINGSPNNVK